MDNISNRVYCVSLAALLHDIGKPFQRANNNDRNTLCHDARGMEQGLITEKPHSLWTADFIFKNQYVFKSIPQIGSYGFENFVKLASKHHQPDNDKIDEKIIKESDSLSAGHDRKADEEKEDGKNYIQKPLVSIFTTIFTGIENTPHYYELSPLQEEREEIFPTKEVTLSIEKYKKLTDDFTKDFNTLPYNNPYLFFEALALLIVKYFWCVPSSTMEGTADIPLADHLLTTSAIAATIALANEKEGKNINDMSYMFIWGDFAGIQNFIFSLSGETNREIAKLLRGRSFMVNMYNFLAARMIVDSCGLPIVNIVSIAGGKFKILLPDIEFTKSKLKECKEKLEKWLYRKFSGDLLIFISEGVSFKREEFSIDKYKDLSKKVNNSLNREKLKPFSKVFSKAELWKNDDIYSIFLSSGGCKICSREPAENGEEGKGKNCKQFIEIGRKVTNSNIIKISKENKEDSIFGLYNIEFYSDEDLENSKEDIFKSSLIFRFNLHQKQDSIKYFLPEFHYANYVPFVETEEDNTLEDIRKCKTFEDIADSEEEGLDALGVLKADADMMGFVFMCGFRDKNEKSRYSISREVSLSRMLNWFFAGYMPYFIKSNEKYKNIYTLFAGGDDLCLVGRWNRIIEFAKDIREKFRLYCGYSSDFTISAGISLFKAGYPLSSAVLDAEEELEKSKANGRDRITLFGYSMGWEDGFESQLNFVEDWKKFVEESSDNIENERKNGMLYRFFKYHKEWEEAKRKNRPLSLLKHRFRFIYDINRNLKPKDKEEIDWRERKPFVDLLITKNPLMDESPLFTYLPVGITIATYNYRKNKVENKEKGDKNG